MPTIGILTNVLPTTPSQAGSPRLFHLTKEWSRDHKIIYICISKEEVLQEDVLDLIDGVTFLPPPPLPTLKGRIIHRILNLPYFFEAKRNPEYVKNTHREIRNLVKEQGITHLHVNQLLNAQYVPEDLDIADISIDIRDALPALYMREASVQKNFLSKVDHWLEAYAIGSYLKKIDKKGYFLSMVSQADTDYLKDKWGVRTEVIPNGVDLSLFERTLSAGPRKPIAIFTGIMNYRPNIDTAINFAENIFPLVRKYNPQIEFHVVGMGPTEEVLALERIEGVKVLGMVPSMQPYLENASVFVCPMRLGAGIKNKILSAMAAELPIVATTMGVAGVEIKDGEHFLLRNDNVSFAKAVLDVVEGTIDTTKLIENAKNKSIQSYSWEPLAKLYLDRVSQFR